MNDTERKPAGGPSHMRNTGAYPTVPLCEALARRRAGTTQVPPPQIQPGHDAPAIPVPVPVDPAAADANSTHLWPVVNADRRPSPRPPTAPVVSAAGPDWRSRLGRTVRHMPWQARLLATFLLVCLGVVAAVLIGAVS